MGVMYFLEKCFRNPSLMHENDGFCGKMFKMSITDTLEEFLGKSSKSPSLTYRSKKSFHLHMEVHHRYMGGRDFLEKNLSVTHGSDEHH